MQAKAYKQGDLVCVFCRYVPQKGSPKVMGAWCGPHLVAHVLQDVRAYILDTWQKHTSSALNHITVALQRTWNHLRWPLNQPFGQQLKTLSQTSPIRTVSRSFVLTVCSRTATVHLRQSTSAISGWDFLLTKALLTDSQQLSSLTAPGREFGVSSPSVITLFR